MSTATLLLLGAALLALAALAAVFWFVYPFRILTLLAMGRSHCDWAEAWSAPRYRAERLKLRAELARSARIVEEDGAVVRWEIAGERYWMPRGSGILPGMLADQKRAVYEAAGGGVKAGDVVVDCGANVGLFTLHALERGAAHVVAVELSPRNLGCLRRNLAAEVRAGRVTIVEKGVWDTDAALPLRMQPGNSAADSVALSYRGSRRGPTVPLTTLDAIVRELGLQRVDYIKMDVEGAEREALRGAAGTLCRFHPQMTIAMEHRFEDPRDIPKVVAEVCPGYRARPGPCVDFGNALRPVAVVFQWGAPAAG